VCVPLTHVPAHKESERTPLKQSTGSGRWSPQPLKLFEADWSLDPRKEGGKGRQGGDKPDRIGYCEDLYTESDRASDAMKADGKKQELQER